MHESWHVFILKALGGLSILGGILLVFLSEESELIYFLSGLLCGVFWFTLGRILQLLEHAAGAGQYSPRDKRK